MCIRDRDNVDVIASVTLLRSEGCGIHADINKSGRNTFVQPRSMSGINPDNSLRIALNSFSNFSAHLNLLFHYLLEPALN